MVIKAKIDLVRRGRFANSQFWRQAQEQVSSAVQGIDWPHGSGSFTINPERKGNGVVPIKAPAINYLQSAGWVAEQLPPGSNESGGFDLLTCSAGKYIGLEWETGNVASSYRSIDKSIDLLRQDLLSGAFIIVPSKSLAKYLTDRIGNWEELEKRLGYWQAAGQALISNGAFQLLVIEHDQCQSSAPLIPKGRDGNAFRARAGSI